MLKIYSSQEPLGQFQPNLVGNMTPQGPLGQFQPNLVGNMPWGW